MRKSWDQYFMNIATEVATRATCDRKHVGAVIVNCDRNILATGYNGSLPGTAHCDDAGHMMVFDPNNNRESCVRTVHAEANAICQAARNGNPVLGATIYTTASPCWNCFKQIASAGITKIVFGELYKDERIYSFARASKVTLDFFGEGHIQCVECHRWFSDSEYDTGEGDGCHCHEAP